MIGVGTVINPIVKIVTTVAILAAVGIFIVKPVLETTEKVVDESNRQIAAQQKASQAASAASDLNFSESRARAFVQSLQSTWPAAAREVNGCVKRARGDGKAMARCERAGEKLVHGVQSDRSFALSYATSLAAQGDAAGAERVRDCVSEAGFRPAAMQRCRGIADQLLFG